uniref:Uncharacterized protein n=1 Tax=Utricularia reniformis TaxID=192314 RepID=A0A1Y0B4A3_9LAMI|nr:hypothetical protein AEK19_MT2088 [Utricularia reniformis]ART32242.1 hypothetical protein AEK19_MT2088 [Utricularia reniformis]
MPMWNLIYEDIHVQVWWAWCLPPIRDLVPDVISKCTLEVNVLYGLHGVCALVAAGLFQR